MRSEEVAVVREYLREANTLLAHAERVCEQIVRQEYQCGRLDAEADFLLYQVSTAFRGVRGVWETAQQMVERKRFDREREQGGKS